MSAGRGLPKPIMFTAKSNFRYANLDALYWVATEHSPETYLEIGVWRGDSLKVVLDNAPIQRLVLSDVWSGKYELRYKNHDHISAMLRERSYTGKVDYLDGDSKNTVPKWGAGHPSVQFDLVHVDGDHSFEGARQDLENTWPMVVPRGFLVFDDILYGTPYPPQGKFWLLGIFYDFLREHRGEVEVDSLWIEREKESGFGLVRKI